MSKRTVVLALAALAVVIVFGVVRGQTYALDRPSLTATEVDGSVLLEWSAVEGATRYGLWQWDCVDGWQRVGGRDWETTQATHVDPVDGRTYKYTVQALNDRGETSDWASRRENRYLWVRETVNPIPFPAFEVVQHSDRIELVISPVEKAAGYRALVWHEGAGGSWLRMPEVDLETLRVSYFEVEPDVEYYFTVQSYSENRCGYSDWATYQYVVYDPDPALPFTPTPPPGGGTGGTTGGDGTGDGTDDGGDDGNGVTGAVNTATATHTATATAAPGSTATHTATATATATDSDVAPPGSTPTGTPTPRPRPGRVNLTHADSTHNSITVYWEVPDPPALEYVLRAGRDRDVKQTIYTGSATSFTWTGLDANTTYYFSALARNSPAFADTGPFAYVLVKATKVDPDDLADYVPGAPTGLSAANDPTGGVRLTWSRSTRTQPSDCNCPDTDIHIFRRQHSSSGLTYRDHHIGTTLNRDWFLDDKAREGVTYVYHVKAVNRHGPSAASNSVMGTYHRGPTPTPTATPAPPAKPGAPTVQTLYAGTDGYQVSWTNPNDPSITSFIVLRRKVQTGAVFTKIAEGAPANFGPNALGNYVYTDSGVPCGTHYAYRLQFRSAAGLSPQSSSTRSSAIHPCPTATPDPCASADCNRECETTCCPQACMFCGPGPSIPALEFTAHYRLHLMLVHRDRAENRRLLQGHPYYTLHEEK